jgi:tight adherence protein B
LTLLHRGFPRLKDLKFRLEEGGMTISVARFVQVAVLLTLMGGFLGWAYSQSGVGLLLGAALGAWIPFLFLKLKRRARTRAFEKQFPEALRLLATSLRAGHALAASIRILGEELPAPVGVEFQKVAEESNLGLSVEDALQNLLSRMDNPDLRFFVTSVLIQRETGGNLATILQNLDQLIRERFKIRGQVKALTAPGRLTGMILAVLPLGVGGIMVLINPLYMEPLWKTGMGQFFAILSFVLQIMGYFMIRKIVNVRY